ncbi:MAG: glycosyltransferase family 2 protein [Bacteroidales bacterium]|nr:glycosyltransferase family 2 protein [Bacteroidales bacterium]
MKAIQEIDLSIVIVSWNCRDYLVKCLESIRLMKDEIVNEIIVVDNNSNDGTISLIKSKYPEVIYIENHTNIGFPAANNQGFNMAMGRYILALNPDTEVSSGAFEIPVKYLDANKSYGCVGIKQLKPNGAINYQGGRNYNTIPNTLSQFLYLDKLFPHSKLLGNRDMTYWDHDSDLDVEVTSGAFMLFSREVYEKLGGLSTLLPMYLEDGEFCYRMNKNGYKIRYLASVYFTHHTNKSSDHANLMKISFMLFESVFQFLRIREGKRNAWIFVWAFFLIFPLRILMLPVICAGQYYKKKEIKFIKLVFEIISSLLWTLVKILNIKYKYSFD